MEENEIMICASCYEENKKGAKACWNCGTALYYNDEKELEEVSEDDVIFFNEDNFDNFAKCMNYVVAVDKENEEICIFYRLKKAKTIPFNKIIECKIVENSNVLEKGGVGRAIVGGIIARWSRSSSWSKYKKK